MRQVMAAPTISAINAHIIYIRANLAFSFSLIKWVNSAKTKIKTPIGE